MLAVKGHRADEQRELIAIDVAGSGSEATFDALLSKVKRTTPVVKGFPN